MKKLLANIEKYLGFLKDNSELSTIRITTFLMVLVSVFYIVYQTLLKLPIDFFGVSSYIAVALAGKTGQKYFELSTEKEINKSKNETQENMG